MPVACFDKLVETGLWAILGQATLTLDFCPDQSGRNRMHQSLRVAKILLSNVYSVLLGNPYKNFTLVVLAELPSIFMYLKLPHWFGRKNILIFSQIITGICCIIGGLLTQVKSLKKGAVHHKFHEFPIPNSNFQKKKSHWLQSRKKSKR